MYTEHKGECDYGLGITVISRMLLMSLVDKAVAANKTDFARDILMPNVENLVICGYEHKGVVAVMDSMQGYVGANMQLLAPNVRADLFNKERPVYTKVKDSMPTRYGIGANTTNSLIADGCVIEGTVKNSILFRGVKVGKGACVENCIIMQGTEIGSGADLKYLTVDKEVKVGNNRSLCGSPSYYVYVNKGTTV
jgi:glucose-1-phosphate adenylyltransferase